MNKSSLLEQREIEGSNFNAAAFMRGLITNVDLKRSGCTSKPNQLIESSAKLDIGEKKENRLNTFYRLLGLPATRNSGIITNKPLNKNDTTYLQLSQQGTLNYFDSGSITVPNPNPQSISGDVISGDAAADLLVARDTALNIKNNSGLMSTMMADPLPLDASVQPLGQFNKRRVNIFPTLVDASLPIFPLKFRTAPLFYPRDFILGGDSSVRLPRPFIENIIYIRTKVFSGQDFDTLKADLQANINKIKRDGGLDITDAESPAGITSTLLELKLENRLLQSIQKSAVDYKLQRDNANRLSKQVKYSPEGKDNPSEAAGNTGEEYEGLEVGQLDTLISQLELQIMEIAAFNELLPTKEVIKADKKYREDTSEPSRSIIPDALINEFTDLLTTDLNPIQNELNQAKSERKRLLTEFDIVREKIQFYSGEVSGLSIFDVLCVLLALFTIEIDELVMLLNKEARANLANSSFYSFTPESGNSNITKFGSEDKIRAVLNISESVGVKKALSSLEIKIRENFELARAFYERAKTAKGAIGTEGEDIC